MLSNILIVVCQLDSSQVVFQTGELLDAAHQRRPRLLQLRIVFELLKVEIHLVASLVIFTNSMLLKHGLLMCNKLLFIDEGDQASSLPRQGTSIQIDVEIQWEI